MSLRSILRLLKQTYKEWQTDDASRLAAALAYYTVVSLAPLLIIAIAIAGAIFGEEAARGEIVGQIQDLVGPEGAKVIEMAIANASRPDTSSAASIISILALLFGASGVFNQLQESLNIIWDVKVKPNQGAIAFIRKRILSFTAVLGMGFIVLVSLIVSAVLSAINTYFADLVPGFNQFWELVDVAISFIAIAAMFALMYKFLPDVKIRWRDVWMGATITAFLFTIGKFLLGIYLARGSFASAYGAASSLVILLVWVYYSAQILFFGAEFTQVYARKFGSEVVPEKYAMFVNKKLTIRGGTGESV